MAKPIFPTSNKLFSIIYDNRFKWLYCILTCFKVIIYIYKNHKTAANHSRQFFSNKLLIFVTVYLIPIKIRKDKLFTPFCTLHQLLVIRRLLIWLQLITCVKGYIFLHHKNMERTNYFVNDLYIRCITVFLCRMCLDISMSKCCVLPNCCLFLHWLFLFCLFLLL